MLVQPAPTLAGLVAGERGGLADLLLLLLLQLLAVHLPRLVQAVWFMIAVNYTAGFSSLLNLVAQSVLYPVVAVFIGTVVCSLATRTARGRASRDSGANSSRERVVDLAALAVVPAVCLELVLTLVTVLVGWRPGSTTALVVTIVGALWFVALLLLAIRILRREGTA